LWPAWAAIQSRANGSQLPSALTYELYGSSAADATLVSSAVLLPRIGALKPPACHGSSMTISLLNFGSSPSLLAKSVEA
jgi:hypothetical protein